MMHSLFAHEVSGSKIVCALGLTLVAAACGDSSSTGAGGAGTSTSNTSSAKSASVASTGTGKSMCIQPGDPGNANGVGRYCTPGGKECAAFPLAPLCLADVGQDEWFCTRIGCDATTACGPAAGCLLDPQGSACVACKCEPSAVGCGTSSSSSASSSSTSSTTSTGTGN